MVFLNEVEEAVVYYLKRQDLFDVEKRRRNWKFPRNEEVEWRRESKKKGRELEWDKKFDVTIVLDWVRNDSEVFESMHQEGRKTSL